MGVAIEMPAAVAALRVEVDYELCERAVVQGLALPCENGAGLQPAVILLAEAIHRYPPEAATAAMNRRPRSSIKARSTLTRRLCSAGLLDLVPMAVARIEQPEIPPPHAVGFAKEAAPFAVDATACCWNIRTLPPLSTMCQADGLR
jgi:hypothetical protein